MKKFSLGRHVISYYAKEIINKIFYKNKKKFYERNIRDGNYFVSKFGLFLNKNFSSVYKLLKPYFPDR